MELLSVSPQQLTFYAPYNGPQRRTLTLLNPSEMIVLFKVKSNAFRQYRLKPNAGKVEPYATIEIRVCLRCFDFHKDQEYHHYLSIHSFIKPNCSCNGETPLATFRSLPQDQINTKCLPIKLETTPLFLSNPCLEAPCLRQMILEKDQPLRPVCPQCAVPSKPKKCRRRGNKCVVIIIVVLLAVLITAYLLRKRIYSIFATLKNFIQNQMDCLQCNSQDDCLDSLSGSCTDYSPSCCNSPDSCMSPDISSTNLTLDIDEISIEDENDF